MSAWERKKCDRIRASSTFCRSPLEGVRTRLMRTFEPLKDPSYTHPRRESEIEHDSGSTFLTPHILLSSSSGSRNWSLLGSEMLERTCASGECGTEGNGVRAHIVQIVDKPNQILVL